MSIKNKQMEKDPSPKAVQKLKTYFSVRQKLFDYFFKNIPLNINNKQCMSAYTEIYTLMNDTSYKLYEDKKYEEYQITFLKQYKKDLSEFCQRCKQWIKLTKNIDKEDYVEYVLKWIYDYTRFMHWTFKTFMIIQKNSLYVKGTNLYNQGLKILRSELVQPIYEQLFQAILDCLQKFKENKLKSCEPLQQIINLIGILGFNKYRYIKLQKIGQKFMFFSVAKENQNNQQQIGMQTQYFKRNFTNKLIKILKNKYQILSQQMIKLSTSQYVDKALKYLNSEEKTANMFYQNKKVKNLIIRSLDQVLAHQPAENLINKPKTGLFCMLQSDSIEDAKKLYQLIKRSSNFKLFTKQYQRFIEAKGSQILDKISPEDQKMAKKDLVNATIQQLFELYEKIQKMTSQVTKNDMEVQAAQTYGFQQICNKGDKVCNFLGYYSDNILRKQQDNLNQQYDLTTKISKISKNLYSYDAFLKLYQKLLGLRILYDNFKNRDLQFCIINILKNQAGVSALNKISCMISDYLFSENFNIEKIKFKNQIGYNVHAMILTSGSWQIQDSKNGKSCVPPQLMKTVQLIQNVYNQQLPDRALTWIFNYGRAIAQVKFDDQAKHLLIMNNYQLLILLHLQRNNFKPAKIGQLLSELKVDDEPAFNASLMMIVKTGVLLKEGNAAKIQSKSQTISFNFKFKYKTLKVGCFQVPRYVQRGTVQSNGLNLQRAYIVDAAIVKVMKTNRVIKYSQLISEVQKWCKTFKADVALIKKRIENCQQRQFLQRDANDMNTLIYKP